MLHCISDWPGAIGQDNNKDEGFRFGLALNSPKKSYKTLKKIREGNGEV
jgi:hypothetical protein